MMKTLKIFFFGLFIMASGGCLYYINQDGEISLIGAYLLWLIDPIFLLPIGDILMLLPDKVRNDNLFYVLNIIVGYFWWFKLFPYIFRKGRKLLKVKSK